MSRLVLLALVLGAGVAHAEGMTSDMSTLKFNKLLIHEDNAVKAEVPKTPEASVWKYFNLAHCVCSLFQASGTPNPDFHEAEFEYEVTVENPTGTTTVNRPAEVWVGTGCNNDDTTQRNADCTKLTDQTTPNLTAIEAAGFTNVEVPIFKFMTPKPSDRNMGGCIPRRLTGTTYLLVDENTDDKFDYWVTHQVDTDSEAPPLPTNFKAIGAEEAVEISWDPPTDVSDTAYYQALCAAGPNADQVAIKATPPAPRYQTPNMLCGAGQNVTLMPTDISSNAMTDPDAGTTAMSFGELATQNPAFICGESASATATSLRIKGLTNGTPYLVALLAIDKYGNASGVVFNQRLTPVPATDFWEDIHNQGSGVEGGFCLISQTFGDDSGLTNTLRSFRDDTLASTAFGRWLTDVYYALSFNLHRNIVARIAMAIILLPFIAFALLWHVLTLPGLLAIIALLVLARRRSKRLRLQLATAAVLLLPLRAHAQTPYWEDESIAETQDELAIGDPERVKWHAGVRIGPYVPGIDKQIDMPTGKYAGPYEQMFGGYSIMPVIDVERFFYRGFGQAGIAVSAGYMGKKAHAWAASSMYTDANRERSAGDSNTFRLFPLTLSAVYRFSYLDDEYGIPLVPYARVGLGYYVWWIVGPNGDFAESCNGPETMGCPKTTAAGASLGFVGSVGLAIRAERIDPAAARSMRESGIEHAGFYGEYSVGKVDGFGSDKKLSVGDATWFAGVDFEF